MFFKDVKINLNVKYDLNIKLKYNTVAILILCLTNFIKWKNNRKKMKIFPWQNKILLNVT